MLIEPDSFRIVIEWDRMEIEVYFACVLSCLFSHYSESGEEVAYSSDDHGLYLVVCLNGLGIT